jgi:DNA-binding GntR family transcriptional regulator
MPGASSTSASDAYEILRGRLVRGDFRAGVRLTEEQLALELHVSRTPIREALRRLVSDGLLRFVPNVGTFVASWTDDDIRDLFDLRVLLESNIASLAAQRIAPADIDRLVTIQDEIERQGPDIASENLQRINGLNREFHRVISAASGSSRMSEMLSNAIEIPIVQQTFARYTPEQLSRSFGHHREVIDAFVAGDSEWARDVMSCHVRAARAARLPPRREPGNGSAVPPVAG